MSISLLSLFILNALWFPIIGLSFHFLDWWQLPDHVYILSFEIERSSTVILVTGLVYTLHMIFKFRIHKLGVPITLLLFVMTKDVTFLMKAHRFIVLDTIFEIVPDTPFIIQVLFQISNSLYPT